MPLSNSENYFTFTDFLRCILKFLISPLLFFTDATNRYTKIAPFYYTNHAFWHCLYLFSFGFIVFFVPIDPELDDEGDCIGFMWCAYFANSAFVLFEIYYFQQYFKPQIQVQRMDHVVVGLFGMILSIWSMIGCAVCLRMDVYIRTSGCVFLLSLCFLSTSFIIFSSHRSRLYVRLPSENMPFSGIKAYVILFGLFHLAVGGAIYWITNAWFLYSVLLISSFLFCIDAYSCFFTDSYMLCEHCTTKYQMMTSDPTYAAMYHVVVRHIFDKKSSKKSIPDGFVFDDELIVDEKWYR